MPFLIMDKNCKSYKVIPFTDGIRIGRGGDNDVVLTDSDDSLTSRNHAHIVREKNAYILVDTSMNGTFVQNERITRTPLVHGLRFRISGYNFSFVEESVSGVRGKETTAEAFDEFAAEKTMFRSPLEFTCWQSGSLKERLRNAGIITESPALLELFGDVEEIAKINVPVLVQGEPGTGKEKVAQILHCFSNPRGAFVPLNCSSIPEGIFESELFGSIKGAFHDAANKPGKLELADNGTLFLDEIGDMGMVLQPKLLRFLEDKQITRLGDTKAKTLNVRVIAATNQDLLSMIGAKSFRDDLYQRLACIKLEIPPLRSRKEDIAPLTGYFLQEFSREHDIEQKMISEASLEVLRNYNWPGNVRELRNILLSAVIRHRGGTIEPEHLPLPSGGTTISKEEAEPANDFLSLKEIEKVHIRKALQHAGGNKLQAAKLLGISRDTLYKKMQKYHLS